MSFVVAYALAGAGTLLVVLNYDEKMLKLEITQSTDLGKEIGYVKIYKELPNVKSSFTYHRAH